MKSFKPFNNELFKNEVPVRTLQQWEQGISAPPEYLVRMMAYIMMLEEKFENTDP